MVIVIDRPRSSQPRLVQVPHVNDSPQLPPHYELVQLYHVDDVMREAARRARNGAGEGTLVWAVEQGDAHTTSDKRWYSPPGNLYCALLLRPDYSNARCGQLAYVAALSVGSALAELLLPMTGLRYRWPSKLYINDLRAGQIMLAASDGHSDPYEWLALGVMVNVAEHPPNPEPEEFVSVHASGATDVTVAQVLEGFARYFLHWINRWAENGFGPIAHQWQLRADGVGEEMTVRVGEQTHRGTFVEVDEEGRLVLLESGQIEQRISVNAFFALDGE